MKVTGTLLGLMAVAVAALVGAPAAHAAPSDRTVVNAWYRDFLGRDATADPGSQHWVDQMDRRNPADLVWAIAHSREHHDKQVAAYYNDHLLRAPDPGARYWVDGATAGRFPLEWAEQNILASQEYVDRRTFGLGNDYVPRFWYLHVLGRAAGDGEERYWADRIRRVGRLAALRELWYSDEAVRHRIDGHYLTLLRRTDPTLGEVDSWRTEEVESDINVQVLMAASPEYREVRQYG
jgi:hypothetical protein